MSSAALTQPVFHHLHLNSTDPAGAIAGYMTLWPETTVKATVAGFDGLRNGRLYLLFNKVSTPPPTQPRSAYWHQVWLTPDVRRYVARARANRMEPEPLYTSDEGGHVDISSDTIPGTLTRSALADARQKGVAPTHQAGFTYIKGPDGLSVEGFERACETERLAQPDDFEPLGRLRLVRALVAARRGEVERADELMREATALISPTDYSVLVTDLGFVEADVARALGRPEGERSGLERALVAAERKGNVVAAARARERLAKL